MQADFGGGWLTVNASREAVLRAWTVAPQDENGQGVQTEITPALRYLRVWPTQQDKPVDYAIHHAGARPTPFRLVLRRLGNVGQPFAQEPVNLAFLNAGGQVQYAHALSPAYIASSHDAPWPQAPGANVSEPNEVFFNIPADIARVRMSSTQAVLLAAYTRPGDLARAVRTPEDSIEPDAAASAIPAWFAIQPLDFERHFLDGASRLLTIQNRLPDERPELIAGRYVWEDFNPVAGGAARVFLAPREPGVPDRAEALATTFRPAPLDGLANFVAEPGKARVDARLAWAANDAASFHYTILLDGRIWVQGAAAGNAGEVTLPALVPGRHHLRILSDKKLRWYASHLDGSGNGPAWVKRSAYRFSKSLQFDVERSSSDEEFISVRLFRPAGAIDRARLRIWVDAPQPADANSPMAGWLFTERLHDVRPSGQHALPLAETRGEKTDAGQPLYIPFPKGSPRGRYRITLIPEHANGWVAVSRITPGHLAKPKLILEEIRNGE